MTFLWLAVVVATVQLVVWALVTTASPPENSPRE